MDKNLIENINKSLITALKSKDKIKLNVLRMVKSALSNEKIKKGRKLHDDDVINVLSKEIKIRKESIPEFKRGGRQDLVNQNEKEIEVLQKYMPKPLSENEVKNIVKKTIQELQASGLKDMGKVMGKVSKQTKGRFEGKKLALIVRRNLGNQ